VQYAIKQQSLITGTRVCCEAVRSAILATAWLLVWVGNLGWKLVSD